MLFFLLSIKRTIGKLRDVNPVGIERAYNQQLSGKNGLQMKRKIDRGVWVPQESKGDILPSAGNNILTTIRKQTSIKKYELDKKINFIGKIENTKLNEYLKNADIFIQASNYEGLPHSILEAINYEIPILSTEVGVCSAILNKGERGYIIPMPVSEVEISEGIKTIINNKNEAKSKVTLAKKYLNQEYNFKTNAEIYHEKIKEVVKSQ